MHSFWRCRRNFCRRRDDRSRDFGDLCISGYVDVLDRGKDTCTSLPLPLILLEHLRTMTAILGMRLSPLFVESCIMLPCREVEMRDKETT